MHAPRKENAMPQYTLDAARKKQLKQQAHHLKPVVRIGQKGVTEGVIAETDAALDHHELIKVHVAVGDREPRRDMAERLARKTRAHLVHQIGKMFVLYRERDGLPHA
jgi:RNA-binding protein